MEIQNRSRGCRGDVVLVLAMAWLAACTDPGRIVLQQLPDDAYGSGPPVAFQQRVALRAAQRAVGDAREDAVAVRPAAEGSAMTLGTRDTAATPLVDLNHASLEELISLPRIGPAMAERIVAARPFSRPQQLQRVRGIGEATWRLLRDRVCVDCAIPQTAGP